MGSFSIWHWLIVLLVVVLIFGTKKLRNIGSDVGGAVKNFKEAVNEGKSGSDATNSDRETALSSTANTALIEAEVVEVPVVKAAPKKKAATATKKAAATKTAAPKPKAATARKAATVKPKVAATKKVSPQ